MKPQIKLLFYLLGVILTAVIAIRLCKPSERALIPLNPAAGDFEGFKVSSNRDKAERNGKESFLAAFRNPIELYGKVVDQYGEPVAGAIIKLSPISKPFADGAEPGPTLFTDTDGRFSIKGLRGYSMGVSARRDEGYLHLSPLGGPASSAMISYSGDDADGKGYTTPRTPLILTLHKIGVTEPMVYIHFGNLNLPLDGTPRNLALDSKTGVGVNRIEFRFRSDWNKLPMDNDINLKRFNWSFEARILGGGFAWSDNDYHSVPPEDGYQETVRLEYKENMAPEGWKREGYGSFFVKFADGRHGRIRFRIEGSTDSLPLTLTTWLNLKPGSRNLATDRMTPSSAGEDRYKIEWR